MNRGRMADVRLVAACRNRPKFLDFRKEILHLVPPPVHLPIVIPRHLAVALRWYHRHGTSWRLSTLPGRPVGVQRPVLEEEQNARDGQARPRPPLSCSSNPRGNGQCPVSRSPLAPDAFRCAWTIVPSANAHSKSGSSDNASETRWKTPLLARRRNRWKTPFHFPNRAGRSRHGHPVRTRRKTPSTKRRLSLAATPRSLFFPPTGAPCAPAPRPLKPSCRHSW